MTFSVQEVLSQQEWDSLINEQGGHPLQLWGWGELKSRHRWRAERLVLRHGDQVVALAQLLSRNLPRPLPEFVYVPRGPIVCDVSTAEVADALAEHVRQTRPALALSLEPDEEHFEVTSKWQRARTRILPARTLILDLTQSEDDLIAAMSKKHRQYIRKSEREPQLSIRPVTTIEQLERCLDVYDETAKRAEFGLHQRSYYRDAFTLLGEYGHVWASYVDDAPVAFLWLAASDRTAFELYGGMNAQGQALRANYALKWHAIRQMRARGVQRYDFGGLINDGVTTFKTGFAGHEDQLAGTFDRPLSPWYSAWSTGLPAAKRVLRAIRSKTPKNQHT